MKLYKTKGSAFLEHVDKYYRIQGGWDELINRENLFSYLQLQTTQSDELSSGDIQILEKDLQAPIGNQEVWAAGVTYLRSREARMEESKKSGAADFYDKVYEAERPELFFKANPQRVSGPGQDLYIRKDSSWNVPEPELALFVNASAKILGYTIANDMSSRSIEGENPLYLPQAKCYEKSAGLGPCLYVPEHAIDPAARIEMTIFRDRKSVYHDSVSINRMKRSHTGLVEYLFRECDFPFGVFLMTGTCLVPANDFTLQPGDRVAISIEGIGVLTNNIAFNPAKRG
ncbi:MAG TPA: fumarylacetoacetate hydrolase family protein [Puia sp.]|nr:fumarylacetoacetate hydrolase family protein [Puia sp.]